MGTLALAPAVVNGHARKKLLLNQPAAVPATPARPAALPVNPDGIPAELTVADRWVGWRFRWDGRKWRKLPVNVRTGRSARSNDPMTWAAFDEAWAAYQRGGLDGIGFVLGDG